MKIELKKRKKKKHYQKHKQTGKTLLNLRKVYSVISAFPLQNFTTSLAQSAAVFTGTFCGGENGQPFFFCVICIPANLTQVVDVLPGVLQLEVVRHPHQVEQLSYAEESVLGRVNREGNVLADDSREGLPHELDAVVPVAEPHVQLPLHVLQHVNVCPVLAWPACHWEGKCICWMIYLQPINALLDQIVFFQILCHGALAILPAHKLLVGHSLPREDKLVGQVPLAGDPVVDEDILEGGPFGDLLQVVDQPGCLGGVPGEHRHRGGEPEEVEGADPSLRQTMQLAVRLHHGEGVPVLLADLHQPVNQLFSSLVEGWSIFTPVNLIGEGSEVVG